MGVVLLAMVSAAAAGLLTGWRDVRMGVQLGRRRKGACFIYYCYFCCSYYHPFFFLIFFSSRRGILACGGRTRRRRRANRATVAVLAVRGGDGVLVVVVFVVRCSRSRCFYLLTFRMFFFFNPKSFLSFFLSICIFFLLYDSLCQVRCLFLNCPCSAVRHYLGCAALVGVSAVWRGVDGKLLHEAWSERHWIGSGDTGLLGSSDPGVERNGGIDGRSYYGLMDIPVGGCVFAFSGDGGGGGGG